MQEYAIGLIAGLTFGGATTAFAEDIFGRELAGWTVIKDGGGLIKPNRRTGRQKIDCN